MGVYRLTRDIPRFYGNCLSTTTLEEHLLTWLRHPRRKNKLGRYYLLIDGLALTTFLYGNLQAYYMGQWKQFVRRAKGFVDSLRWLGYEPIFCFDSSGYVPLYAQQHLFEKRHKEMLRNRDLYEKYTNSDGYVDPSCFWCDANNNVQHGHGHRDLPITCGSLLLSVFQLECDCQVWRTCGGYAQQEICAMARVLGNEICAGVLATKSDYCVYDMDGVPFLWMAEQDAELDTFCAGAWPVSVFHFDRFCDEIALKPCFLPILALLLGIKGKTQDIIFHNKVHVKMYRALGNTGMLQYKTENVMSLVVQYIKLRLYGNGAYERCDTIEHILEDNAWAFENITTLLACNILTVEELKLAVWQFHVQPLIDHVRLNSGHMDGSGDDRDSITQIISASCLCVFSADSLLDCIQKVLHDRHRCVLGPSASHCAYKQFDKAMIKQQVSYQDPSSDPVGHAYRVFQSWDGRYLRYITSEFPEKRAAAHLLRMVRLDQVNYVEAPLLFGPEVMEDESHLPPPSLLILPDCESHEISASLLEAKCNIILHILGSDIDLQSLLRDELFKPELILPLLVCERMSRVRGEKSSENIFPRWQIAAFILHCCIVYDDALTPGVIEQLEFRDPAGQVTHDCSFQPPRVYACGINFAAVFLRGMERIHNVLTVVGDLRDPGRPSYRFLHLRDTMPWAYFDGAVFHLCLALLRDCLPANVLGAMTSARFGQTQLDAIMQRDAPGLAQRFYHLLFENSRSSSAPS